MLRVATNASSRRFASTVRSSCPAVGGPQSLVTPYKQGLRSRRAPEGEEAGAERALATSMQPPPPRDEQARSRGIGVRDREPFRA
jgi:hypothetical protein